MHMTKLDIFGTCVSRDAFRTSENGGNYEICRFIQGNSPLSAVSANILGREIDENDPAVRSTFSHDSDFTRRMTVIDINKSTFSYYENSGSDWLIIDANSCRHDLFKYQGEREEESVYFTVVYKAKLNGLIEKGILPKNPQLVRWEDLPVADVDEKFKKFTEKILERYDENHIILNECWSVPFLVNGESIGAFQRKLVENWRLRSQDGFRLLKKYLPNAHIVPFPSNTIADANHRWGSLPLHFVPEYYDYVLECIDLITGNQLDPAEEQGQISECLHRCELKIQGRYEPIFIDEIRTYEQQRDARKAPYKNRAMLKQHTRRKGKWGRE